MEKPIEVIDYKGYKINIYPDENPESPRDWDNFGTMVCWHKSYHLGDRNYYNRPADFLVSLIDDTNYNSFDFYIDELLDKASEKALILDLYLYEHSGITMSVNPFSCPWDSGQVGFIYVTYDDIRKKLGVKRVTKKAIERARKILIQEVETYDKYIRGNVYGFRVIADDNVTEIDTCWGFYGYKHEESGLLSEARAAIDFDIGHGKRIAPIAKTKRADEITY